MPVWRVDVVCKEVHHEVDAEAHGEDGCYWFCEADLPLFEGEDGCHAGEHGEDWEYGQKCQNQVLSEQKQGKKDDTKWCNQALLRRLQIPEFCVDHAPAVVCVLRYLEHSRWCRLFIGGDEIVPLFKHSLPLINCIITPPNWFSTNSKVFQSFVNESYFQHVSGNNAFFCRGSPLP